MEMSKACLPPPYHAISEKDRQHPRFAEYLSWRAAMSNLLVEASGFADWLTCTEGFEHREQVAKHPRYKEFQKWMWATRAGGRKCPAGNTFPVNFYYWLEGGRW